MKRFFKTTLMLLALLSFAPVALPLAEKSNTHIKRGISQLELLRLSKSDRRLLFNKVADDLEGFIKRDNHELSNQDILWLRQQLHYIKKLRAEFEKNNSVFRSLVEWASHNRMKLFAIGAFSSAALGVAYVGYFVHLLTEGIL